MPAETHPGSLASHKPGLYPGNCGTLPAASDGCQRP